MPEAIDPDFDVIVVGAGVAGCVAAYQLAKAGLEVALIERGETPGSKNLSGGVLYSTVMDQVFPDFLAQAPIERRIDRNQLCFLNADSWVAIDYADERLGKAGTAVTVLRARLDAWLAEQCELAGVAVMAGVRVDALLREGPAESPRIVGVQAGEDELRARVVVAADGVNSFLCRDAGLRQQPPPHHLAVGVKALVRLPQDALEQRFGLSGDSGAALAVVGACTQGIGGGGFLYTNRDSISVGVVLRLDDLVAKGASSNEVFDQFLQHPFVAGKLEGGDLVEYGCHMVAEGGREMRRRLTWDGLVVVGDAAGFTINNGLTVRGMDLAAGSGIAAATAISAAITAGDTSAAGLARYDTELDAGFVGQDIKTYARAPKFLESERLYGAYGELLANVMHGVFNVDSSPRKHLAALALHELKKSPVRLGQLVSDGWGAVRAL
ncbi:FAD-dependent oxidoreductase [Tessaracoccus sp. Z1128]